MKNKFFTILHILALALMMVVTGCSYDQNDPEKTFSIAIINEYSSPITKIMVSDIYTAVLAEKTVDVPTGRASPVISGTVDNGEYVTVRVWVSNRYQPVTGSVDVPTKRTKALTLTADLTLTGG
jgi:hypothetical protein